MTPQLVAWRISNQRWSLWHITTEPGYTICGHTIPFTRPWGGPTFAPYQDDRGKNRLAGACRTCRNHHVFAKEAF